MAYPTSLNGGVAFNDSGAMLVTTTAPSQINKNAMFPADSSGVVFIDFTNSPTASSPVLGGVAYNTNGAVFTNTSAPTSTAVSQGGIARSATGQLQITFTTPSPGFVNGGLKTNGVGSVFCSYVPSFELRFADSGAGVVSIVETVSGVAPTFTRATSAWTNLSDGTIGLVASGSPRSYYSPTGTYLGYLAEGARTNLCQRGEDFSTVWTDVGTPTLSAGTTSLGALSLSTVGDDSAAALEGKIQTIAFTGDAVKAISLYVKRGTATSSVVRVRDTGASADRLLAAITWSGNVPVVTMTTGTDLTGTPAQQGSSGVYRLSFATTAVTAANTNSLQIYPATDAALAIGGTGTIQVGGVQAEDAAFPSSLIRTPGSATVTRNADFLTYPLTGWFNAAAGTFLVRSATSRIAATTQSTFSLSASGGDESYRLGTFGAGESYFIVVDGAVTQANINGGAGTANVPFSVAAAYSLNDFAISKDGATAVTDSSGTLPTPTLAEVGTIASVEPAFGTISRIAYWNTRLANAVLQGMTA